MPFGQQSGPPASVRQVQQLLELVQTAGFSGFREARGALGLNQRQAAGRFTQDEAVAFITQLEDASESGTPVVAEATVKTTTQSQVLRVLPAEELAKELERRGWIVVPPA